MYLLRLKRLCAQRWVSLARIAGSAPVSAGVGPRNRESSMRASELLSNLAPAQLVFITLFAATWLIGGNIVIALHYRRLGKPWWHGFRPFAFPFKDFNTKEWTMLAVLAALALTFGAIAIELGQS